MHKNREQNLAMKSGFLQKFFMFYGVDYAIILTTESESVLSAKERL
jgi:hypothetical protein